MQVWCENKMIGHLLHDVPDDARTYDIVGKISGSAELGLFSFNVKRRALCIQNYKVAMMGETALRNYIADHHVPEDAVVERDMNLQDTRYTWKVLECDLETSEIVFDMNRFVPYEGDERLIIPELHGDDAHTSALMEISWRHGLSVINPIGLVSTEFAS